jgi:dTDP-4-dehydrorhamnose reductase
MSRVVIAGGAGQLANDLIKRWPERRPDDHVLALGHKEFDVTDSQAAHRILAAERPSILINCAAYHRVDEIEDNPERAFAVNATAVRNLALLCRELDIVLVHLSTDYVFSGTDGRRPHRESDPIDPPNVYGVSKAAGELLIRLTWSKHFIVRGSGLYGIAGSSGKGGNFVETMLRLAGEGKAIKVVDDQTLTPTATWFLADQIALLTTSEAYGTYHATCQGECTWFEFAREIFRQAGLRPELRPQTTADSGARATRPMYSVLDNARLRALGLDVMPTWQDALQAYLAMRRVRVAS